MKSIFWILAGLAVGILIGAMLIFLLALPVAVLYGGLSLIILANNYWLGVTVILLDVPLACLCWLWPRAFFKRKGRGNEDCGKGAKNKPKTPVISGKNYEEVIYI